MLQALLNNKLKSTFKNDSFKPSEDSKTSSVFGLIQYLPAQTMWDLLRQSCGDNHMLIKESGRLQDIKFWPRWSAEGNEITNSNYVEPDVFCEFEKFDLIIEAKKDDGSGQYEQQWENEINAYLNEYSNNEKILVFIAMGGNETLTHHKICLNAREYPMYHASWQNLLENIVKFKNGNCNNEENRILSDIISAFEKHGHFSLKWLETLFEHKGDNIDDISKDVLILWNKNLRKKT